VIVEIPKPEEKQRQDSSKEKRVELHLHTQMSQMDGVSSVENLINRAASWGMEAIAITDHGVVQAFPEANKVSKDLDIKVIYGVEAYLVSDIEDAPSKARDLNTYVVFDIETTGLGFRTEKITEIGAVKIQDGKVIDEFETFVNPGKPIPPQVVAITNITDDMVKDADAIKEVMPKFLEFIKGCTLVAHNADFDIGFIRHNCEELGLEFNNKYIDTLALSRQLFPEFKKHKLGFVAEQLGIKVTNAHRALDDVNTLVRVFEKMQEAMEVKKSAAEGDNKETKTEGCKEAHKALPSYHAILLAKNEIGLKNLYKLISISHLEYFHKRPRILKSVFKKYSEGLILGSACEQGEVYSAVFGRKV